MRFFGTPGTCVPLQLGRTDNAYHVRWAMLPAVRQRNRQHDRRIDTVLCPGLATGVAQVLIGEAARQMTLAYQESESL